MGFWYNWTKKQSVQQYMRKQLVSKERPRVEEEEYLHIPTAAQVDRVLLEQKKKIMVAKSSIDSHKASLSGAENDQPQHTSF